MEGVDFSWGRPGAAALKAAGKTFVIRYVPYPGDTGKGMTPEEVAEYQAAGLSICLVYERTAGRALTAGAIGGAQDATEAQGALQGLGLRLDLPIYFAVDRDVAPSDWPAVDAYLGGAAAMLGIERVGVYGEFDLIQHCREAGTATWFWQTYAWSGGKVDPDAHLYQYLNGQSINGSAVDFNISRLANYGQEAGYMEALPNHKHISERESDGTWEDCTWDAGLEFYRDAIDPSVPATHAEAQALRKASGEPATGGSNLGDFRAGVKARYGKSLPAAVSAKTILSVLKPGYCGVVQGSMSAFGPTHPLSKWQTNFDAGHAVYIANVAGTYWWCDPLAPTTAAVPVKATADQITKYVNAFAGQAIVAPVIKPAVKEDIVNLKTYTPGYTASVKPESNVRLAPQISATKVHTTTVALPVAVIGTVTGDVDPANGSNVWYALWHDGRVEYTAKDNIINLKAPVATDDGFTKATQDAAVAAATAPLKTQIAALQPLADLGTALVALVKRATAG